MATLPFLFNTSYTIEGGNLTSTLAGEFSFSLALTSGLLFLGVFAYALRTGRLRWLAAAPVRGDAAVPRRPGPRLCGHRGPARARPLEQEHVASPRTRRSGRRPAGGVLARPFAADLAYSSSMGYTRVTGVWSNIFPHGYIWMIVSRGCGHPDRDHPPRPDAYRAQRRGRWHPLPDSSGYRPVSSTTAGGCPSTSCSRRSWPPTGSGSCSAWEGRWLQLDAVAGAGRDRARQHRCRDRRLCRGGHRHPGLSAQHKLRSKCPVGSPGTTPVSRASRAGPSTRASCACSTGRAGPTGAAACSTSTSPRPTNPFGSTEATMALPYWTDGCMDTIDGVLFESSTTTPFHFLDQAEYSLPGESSNPVSFLTYPTFNLADGIRHLAVRRTCATSSPCHPRSRPQPRASRGSSRSPPTPGFPGAINQVTLTIPSGTSTSSKVPSSLRRSTTFRRSNPVALRKSGSTPISPGGRTRRTGPSSSRSTGRRTGPGLPSGRLSPRHRESRSSRRP